MAYIELYNDKIFDLINLGKSTTDFNQKRGDYIKVEIFQNDSSLVLQELFSNKLLLKYPDTDEYYLGDYHFHPEDSSMGFCEGANHNKDSVTELQPIAISSIDDPLNSESKFEKQIKVFKDDSDNIYIKPNELINLNKNFMGGKYRLRIYFMRNIKSSIGNYFQVMKNNLIENGNFFAGLEATQAGDIDKSSGKNNFIKTYNPGFSPYVLQQSGLPSNEYFMWITGIKPSSNYVFSCWVAWDMEYNGDKHIVSFSSPDGNLVNFDKTDLMGSYIAESESEPIGGRILKQKAIGGLMWYKLYSFVQTDENVSDSLYIHLGLNGDGFEASTKPLGGRYFTDLRLEEVSSFNGEPIQSYLNGLKGFGDDLGLDGFEPSGFGDDIGFDDFEPEGGSSNGGSSYEEMPEDTVASGELPIISDVFNTINLSDILNGSFPPPNPPNNDSTDEENQDSGIMKFGGKIKRRR